MSDDNARYPDRPQARLDLIETAVRDWKGGRTSAPEAIARVAQVLRVPLAEDAPRAYRVLDADDARLGSRLVTREITADGGRVQVELECGHVVTQIVPIGRHASRRMRCAQCINELIDEHRRQ